MALTDEQRARCAKMCGWERSENPLGHVLWMPPNWRGRPCSEPPPIETMPEEWSKLMERLRDNRVALYPTLERDGWIAYPPACAVVSADFGECVCLAALAMEDGNG